MRKETNLKTVLSEEELDATVMKTSASSAEPRTVNLVFPEDLPPDPAAHAHVRRPRLWPPRGKEASLRWLEAPLEAAHREAREADRRTLILLTGPRASGAPALFAQTLPHVHGIDFDVNAERREAEGAPRNLLARYAALSTALFLNVQRAPQFAALLAGLAGTRLEDPDVKAPKVVIAYASAELPVFASLASNPYVKRLRLRTLVQGELTGIQPDFPERLLAHDFPSQLSHDESNRDLILEIAMHGGYPEGRLGTADERHDFFHDLVRKICATDLDAVSRLRSSMTLRKVYRTVGAASGESLNVSKIAEFLSLGRPLVKRTLDALEALYLVDALPAWPEGEKLGRALKSAKHYVTDSGWLCGLLGFCDSDPCALPPGSEGIVERLIAGWTRAQLAALTDVRPEWRLWHFALRTGLSIPILLENERTGALVAVETSSRENASPEDFVRLRKFCALLKDRPVTLLRLYCGQTVQTFDEGEIALPIAFLWR